jgi:hypothetical protein
MVLFLIAACAPSGSPDFGGGGSRSDSGYVGGLGTGGNEDDDTGAGGGDTGTDTVEVVCGADDLDFAVVVEDEAGNTGLSFSVGARITTRAVFTNPCNGVLRFTTPDGCLVNAWSLTDGVGNVRDSVGSCVDSETTWTFAALEGTSVTTDWGELARSTYQVEAVSTPVGRTATEFFSVQ